VVTKDKGDDEKGDTQEHSDSSDEVDEMGNLLGSNGISPVSSPEARPAILPMTVLSSKLTTIPLAVPSTAMA